MNAPQLAMVIVFLLSAAVRADGRPANVIMLISDDQAWTDYGFMGHQAIETPRLDRLAKESVVFPRGYVPASLCSPSLATLLSGLYPYQHRVTGNDPPQFLDAGGTQRVAPDDYARQRREMTDYVDKMPNLPKLLATKAYQSFQAGKWWLGNYQRGGFTAGMTHGDPARGGRHGDEGLKIGREGMQPIYDFIDGAGDSPYFIWYAPFLPHNPHTPPQRLLEKYLKKTDSPFLARYWACCEWFDETCGALLDYVEKKGQTQDTLVVYVTDNGWIQDPTDKPYLPKSKRSQYDGGLRTPIMVKWPGHVMPENVAQPVSSIDLVPTILKACGIEIPAVMPGIDLLDRDAVMKRDTLFGDIHLHNARDIHDPSKNWTYRWCLRGAWKLILPNKENVTQWAGPGAKGSGEVELYQVLEDPFETKNLAATEPAKVKELTEAINAWWLP